MLSDFTSDSLLQRSRKNAGGEAGTLMTRFREPLSFCKIAFQDDCRCNLRILVDEPKLNPAHYNGNMTMVMLYVCKFVP